MGPIRLEAPASMVVAFYLAICIAVSGCLGDQEAPPQSLSGEGDGSNQHRDPNRQTPSINVTESVYWSGKTFELVGPLGSHSLFTPRHQVELGDPLYALIFEARWEISGAPLGDVQFTAYPAIHCPDPVSSTCLLAGLGLGDVPGAVTLESPGRVVLDSEAIRESGCGTGCSWELVIHGEPFAGSHRYELAVTEFRVPPDDDFNPDNVSGFGAKP